MPIDPDILAEMQAQARTRKLDYCEYYKVEWTSGTKYYSYAPVSRFAPFTGVKKYTGGAHVEKRVIADPNDPFKQFELQPDIRTQDIAFVFEDTDGEMAALFKANGTTRIRVYHYWPQFDINHEVWMGQLHTPKIKGRKTCQTNATNGRRARETKTPWETHQFYCPFTYGELLTTAFAVETNGCPVNVHIGGSIGVGGFEGCPKDQAACNVRLGADQTSGNYFGGWVVNPVSYTSDPHLPGLTRSKGSDTILNQAKRVLAGRKHIAAMQLVAFSRELNPNHPELGFIRYLGEVGLGPFQSITNIKVNDQAPNPNNWAVVLGTLGQGRVDLTFLTIGLSGTGLVIAVDGLGNPISFDGQNLHAECDALGYNKVAIFTESTIPTYTRGYTDDRIWWLLEIYTNQRFGMGQSPEEHWIGEYITAASRLQENVRFTLHGKDGEVRNFDHRRSTFNCLLEQRAFDEQVVDICRSGNITPPFLYEGKYGIDTFRAFTEDELADAPIVTDIGPGNNIVWQDGLPNIDFSQKDAVELINRLKVSFEEFSNKGLSRPIWCDDPDAQLAAGRSESDVDQLKWVESEMTAFGVDELNETLKVGYGWLWFGQLGEGGIHNNLRATFNMPYELTLGYRRYQPVKLVSDLNNYETPDGDPFEFFQILYMYKIGGGLVQVIAQGYNQQKMEAFETDPGGGGGGGNVHTMIVSACGTPSCIGAWPWMGIRNGKPWYQKGGLVTYYDAVIEFWRMGETIYYGEGGDFPWEADWINGTGPDPTPAASEGGGDSPLPAVVPLIPPVSRAIDIGTIVQGTDTITIPLEEV